MSDDSAELSAPSASSEAPPTGELLPPATATTSAFMAPADVPTDAPTDIPTNAPTDAPTATPAPRRRRLRWLWWTAGSLAVTALLGLCAYLVVVSNQWSERVDELTVISEDLGTQVSDQTAARLAAESQAASLQSQLDTATARITELANEEAKATDHEALWINMVDSVFSCADNRQELIDVLTNSRLYFPGKTNAQVEAELVEYCDGIKSEYTDFKAEIGK